MRFAREIARMGRIEGQARGITKMMEEERDCLDLLHQLSAMEAALRSARAEILGIHAADCVAAAIEGDDVETRRTKLAELAQLFSKLRN